MIDFDADTGRLRLDQQVFATLLRELTPTGEADEPGDPGTLVALREAGVLSEDGPAPVLRTGLTAVLAPAALFRLTVADAAGAVFHQGWFDGRAGAVLVQTRGPLHELLQLPPALLAGFVASVTRVGPRRVRADRSITLSDAAADDLLTLDDDLRRAALQQLASVAPTSLSDAIEADQVWTWGAECAWENAATDLAGSSLHVIDSAAGTWARTEDGFEPTSGREVWRALTRLLPDHDDLSARVREGLLLQSSG